MKGKEETNIAIKKNEFSQTTRILLVFGIIASVIYICSDIVAANLLYKGYSYISMQVSELSAVGAPTRPFWMGISIVWAPLIVGFAIGVMKSAGGKRLLVASGIILAMFGLIGLSWVFFAPMQMRGTVALENDLLHIVFAVLQLITMILFMSFGSTINGTSFRIYSVLTIVLMLGFGFWASTSVADIAAGNSTPWMGAVERVSVYLPNIWIIVYATKILKIKGKRGMPEN